MPTPIKKKEDHPRGCGENAQEIINAKWDTGSPPRMRGKPVERTEIGKISRITPADAGKTSAAFTTENGL